MNKINYVTKECSNCGCNFNLQKKDFKFYIFGKKGESFIVIKREKQIVKKKDNFVNYRNIQYKLLKDLKFKGFKCPICGNIDWFVPQLIVNPISLERDGWYILKFAPQLMELKEVGVETESYKTSLYDAENNAFEDRCESIS